MKYSLYILCVAFVFLMAVSCKKKKPIESEIVKSQTPDSLYIIAGEKIIANTFDTLRQSLLSAIQTQGFPHAIDFCNEKANAITVLYGDSVTVRRTAVRYRNLANKPDSLELQVFDTWLREMQSGAGLHGKLIRDPSDDQIHYFKPIVMQALCMNCHGVPQKNIQPATLSAIRKHYPQDLAIDFEEGDLRGAWHLVFRRD